MTDKKTKKPKLDYDITDINVLETALPELVSVETVHRTVSHKGVQVSDATTTRKFVASPQKADLYALIKVNHNMGRPTPGITVNDGTKVPVSEAPSIEV